MHLLLCGDASSNPGPTVGELNALKLLSKGLRFGHWNVNDLTKTKFEQIKMHIQSSNGVKNFDILILSEKFINSTTTDRTCWQVVTAHPV